MSELEKELERLKDQRRGIIKEMQSLEKSEIIKRYFELKKLNEEMCRDEKKLYQKVKEEQFDSCNHILVYSDISYDEYDGHTCRRKGCIKCGLDESVLDRDIDCLSDTQKIMRSYLKDLWFGIEDGIKTEISCDLNLAAAIYSRIKEANPLIDDELAVKYFKVALDDIRNNQVSDERKENRAKRLSLGKFNSWNGNDIVRCRNR